ncbi:MAG: TfoX/Sxy family protein [Anaerolineae bacterium]|nr:TfoX/Sxy family protein [Anaerolineae bacterium]
MADKALHKTTIQRIEYCFPVPPPEMDLDFRHMFGGIGGYVHERIFFVLTGEGPALKFTKATQSDLLQEAPDAINLSWTRLYLLVPPYIWNDDTRLTGWLQHSIDDVIAMPKKKK